MRLNKQQKSYLKVPGNDSGLLVVPGSVAGQLEDLGGQVLHDGGHVDGGAGPHPLGIVAFPQQPVDSSNGELETRTAGSRLGLPLNLASFATTRHDEEKLVVVTFAVKSDCRLTFSSHCRRTLIPWQGSASAQLDPINQ